MSVNYSSALELKQFRNFSVGADLNYFLIDLPTAKTTLHLNLGFNYGFTSVRDSVKLLNENGTITTNGLTNDFTVDSWEFYPEIIAEIQPDRRYGFSFSYRAALFFLFDNRLIQTETPTNFNSITNLIESESNPNVISTFQILAFLNLNDNNNLFFRFRHNFEDLEVGNNYQQIQLGYSFFFTKQSSVR